MIKLLEKSMCCGCSACSQRCPTHSIIMKEDIEGFLYPKINLSKCNKCGLCEKVCPMLKSPKYKRPIIVYSAKNNNHLARINSSSGGVFILLAEKIIDNGGIVFGAQFDKNWEVEHTYADTREKIAPLLRSKYVQSKIGNSFNEVEKFLNNGRHVLFVGTGCQIAGLKSYLSKDYDNLITVDIICHGVPSPGVWRKYLKSIVTMRGENTQNSILPLKKDYLDQVSSINFREKQLGGYNWNEYGFSVHVTNHKNTQQTFVISNKFKDTLYFKGFISNMIIRRSCFSCKHKDGASTSDLTLGDFWGVEKYYPEIDDNKGISVVLVHSQKGLRFLDSLKLNKKEIKFEEAVNNNPSYLHPANESPNRERFFKMYKRNYDICRIIDNPYEPTIKELYKQKIYEVLMRIRKKLC